MPELPEVETIRRDLSQLIVGKKILNIAADSSKQVQPSLAMVKKAILGARIKAVKRRAKVLQIFLDNNQVLLVHLKLTGRLLFRDKKDPQDDFQHVVISLDSGKELRLADLRKFGWLKLVKDKKELEEILSEFGPEPMTDLDFKTFEKIIASTNRPIKIVLMDQKKISGIGNIYANDALFLAKIRPDKPAKKLANSEIKQLWQAMIKVLKAGIKYRGASDQYYLDALGHKGAYQDHFLVYGRGGKKCFQCGGKIKKIKINGRGSFYCPKCQR
jgi:formamidopyrimidine-DNA glycosylase